MAVTILLAAAALAQTPAPPPQETGAIVVTGRRVPDYRAALETCLARL